MSAPASTPDTAAEPAGWKQRIPSLDGLRGVAILMVLVGHGLIGADPAIRRVLRFAGNGSLGGHIIFFVLGGFLIHQLGARELRRTGSFNWRMVYLRRALRIFPCFYLCLGTLLALAGAGMVTLTWQMFVSAATFSLNYRHVWDPSGEILDCVVIGHYWTLALAGQFYLTWPLLILLLQRRRLMPVLAAILLAAPLLRVAFHFLSPGSRGCLGAMFHTGFDAIAAGVFPGEMMMRPAWRERLTRLVSHRMFTAGCLVFLVFLSPMLDARFRGFYAMIAGRNLELACICLVIVAAVSFPGGAMHRLLNWKPLAFVGVRSYSLYVWNNLFLRGRGHWFNQSPWNWVCVFTAGVRFHFLVEMPFLRLKDRFHARASA